MKAKTITLISIALLLSIIITGCSGAPSFEDNNPVAVAILIGNHGNAKAPDLTSAPIKKAVTKAVESYGYLSVISVEGRPNIVLEGSCDIDERYKGADPGKLARDAADRTEYLLNSLQLVTAESPEVDTLEAIRLAVRSLSTSTVCVEKMIVILDSGLCTTGLCDFRNNLLSADPEAVVKALLEREAIPDLTGMTVIWQQLGDVESPQESLTPKQRNRLQEIWTAIIKQGGGTPVFFDAPPSSASTGNKEMPPVSTVSLSVEVPIEFEPETIVEDSFVLEEPIFLREEQVKFVGDSDAFVDSERAVETIAPIAELMRKNPTLRLLLVGTTAGDTITDFGLSLSKSRAEAVRAVLISLGIDESRIVTLGVASSDPWHIPGVGTGGELAAQNRKVVLLDADSDIAGKLILEWS